MNKCITFNTMILAAQAQRFVEFVPLLVLMSIRDIVPMLVRHINNGDTNLLHFEQVSSWCLFLTLTSVMFYKILMPLGYVSTKTEKIYRGSIASLCDIIFSDIERSTTMTNLDTQLFLKTYMLQIKLLTTLGILLYPFFEAFFKKNITQKQFLFSYKKELSICVSILRPLFLFWNCNLIILMVVQILEIASTCILASEIECEEVEQLHGISKREDKQLSNTLFAIFAPMCLHLSLASVISFTYVRCLTDECYWGSINGRHMNVADIVIFCNGLFKTFMYQVDIDFSIGSQWLICTIIAALSLILHILGVQYSFFAIAITVVFLDYFSDKVIASSFDDKDAIAKGKDMPRMLLNLLKYTKNISKYTSRNENKQFVGDNGVTLLNEMVFWWILSTALSLLIFAFGTIHYFKKKLKYE